MFRLTIVVGSQSPPKRRVSYRGTEAQPNPPLHQGNRQPPHKTKNDAQLPHKQKVVTYRSTSGQKIKPTPTLLQRRAPKAEEQRTQVVLHTAHT